MANLRTKIRMVWMCLSSALLGISQTSAQLSDWKNYTSTDCIRNMAVKDNVLWLATEGGLVKYDSDTRQTTIYNRANASIPENDVLSVTSNGGCVWLGTNNKGVAQIEDNRLTSFTPRNSPLASRQYNMQMTHDRYGNLWIGGLLSFYKYDGDKWSVFTIPETQVCAMITYNALAFDNSGKLWFGGLCTSRDGLFGYYSESTGIVRIPGINSVSGIAIDRHNNKWISTTEEGIVKYDGRDFTKFTSANSTIPSDRTHAITTDNNGNVWFGSSNFLVKYSGGEFTKYSLPSTKKYDEVASLLIDGKNFWVGSTRSGLYKFENGELQHMDTYASLIPAERMDTTATATDNGEIWIGTSGGIIHIDKDDNRTVLMESNDTVNKVKDIHIDKDKNVWIALHFTDTCLLRICGSDTVAFTTRNCPIERNSVTNISSDGENLLWVGTEKGLYSFDGNRWTSFNTPETPVNNARITNIATDSKNNLWCSVYGKGLCMFNGGEGTEYNKDNSPLPMNMVRSIAIDQNDNVWIASGESNMGPEFGGGLTCFDGRTWKTYNRSNSGLPSNTITSIAVDANGNLWLGTYGNVGVTMFDGKDKWEIYNTDNSGIADNDIAKISIDRYRNTIWLNGLRSRGISVAQIGGEITGISNAGTRRDSGAMYDLSGTRITQPRKGEIYIQNGKKIIKKQ